MSGIMAQYECELTGEKYALKIYFMGAEEKAQWVKGFLHGHKDLSLDGQHLCKKLGIMEHVCNTNTRRQRQRDPRDSLASQSSCEFPEQ